MGIDKKNGRITRSKSAKHGPKKDVEQRKPKQRGPERGSPPARSNVDAIVYSTFEQAHSDLGSDKIAQRARKEVERGTVDATVNRSNDTIRWGNSKGLSALEEIENMKKQVKFLQEFRTSALVTMNTSDASNAKLTADVQALKLSTDSFLTVRSRCFAIFLRDKIQRCSRTDAKVIKDGNVAAHEGDPLVDAMMYKKGVRSDHRTFTLLYGMPWQQVLDYGTTPNPPLPPPSFLFFFFFFLKIKIKKTQQRNQPTNKNPFPQSIPKT
jgi:hypothetical protein